MTTNLFTGNTFIRIDASVCVHVTFPTNFEAKLFVAVFALVLFCSAVYLHVGTNSNFQRRLSRSRDNEITLFTLPFSPRSFWMA